MNQYYNYEIIDNSEIYLGSHQINFAQNDIFKEAEGVRIRLGSLKVFDEKAVKLSIYDSTFKKLTDKYIDSFETGRLIEVSREYTQENNIYCLITDSKYTTISLCFTAEKNEFSKVNVTIDKIQAGLKGQVILRENKEKVTFKAEFSPGNYVEIKTRKRNILPSRIEKIVEKKIYDVEFYDQESLTESWRDQLGFDQENFKVPLDPLMQVTQDFFNKDQSNKNYKMTYYIPKYKRNKIINSYSIYPELSFSKLSGNTLTENFSIISKLGYTIRANSYKLLPQSIRENYYFDHWVAEGFIKMNDMGSSALTYSISNSQPMLYGITGGLTKEFKDYSWWGLFFDINQDMVAEATTGQANTVSLSSIMNFELGSKVNYVFFQKDRYSANAFLAYYFILPNSSGGQSRGLGQKMVLGSELAYDYNENTFLSFGLSYSERNQNSSQMNLKDQVFDYRFGYTKSY